MSFMLLGILNAQAAGGGSPYFLATFGGAGNDIGFSTAIDSGGNIYVAGQTGSSGAGSNDFAIAKFDSSLTIQWQRTFGGTGDDIAYSLTLDSSDNVYVVGQTDSAGPARESILIAKYNSSGTIQWQRVLGGTLPEMGKGVTTDSSGNVYIVAESRSASGANHSFYVAKYNSSGTIQWQRMLEGGNNYGYGIAIGSSNDVYAVGATSIAFVSVNRFQIVKYNSSGTLQWQRMLSGSDPDTAYAITLDSSDNIYAVGETRSAGAGQQDFLIAKYNSSGTIQWQRILGASGSDLGLSVSVDSLGDVYAAILAEPTGSGNTTVIAKYNSSGTIQWQRKLGGTSYAETNSIAIDANDDLHLLGRTYSAGAGSNDFFLATLPNDGSLTGTYTLDGVDFDYEVSSLTAATSSLTASTSTVTASSASMTSSTTSLTDASSAFTTEIVSL